MTVDIYKAGFREAWDRVVCESRNGTFLHLRAYMDYHADRFDDMSLVARDGAGRIVALLPANRRGDTLESHGGLTYGGWLMRPRADMLAMMKIWSEATGLLRREGIRQLVYKPVPHIYHKYPAEEDIYALWRAGGEIRSVLASSVIDLASPLGFDMSARQSVRKAARDGVTVGLSDRWDDFFIWSSNTFSSMSSVRLHSLT